MTSIQKAQTIKKIETFVQKRLSEEGTGHDWWHIVRVRNNAKAICRTEKVDSFIVDLALLLYDVGDQKVLHTEEDDYSIAENCLREHGVLDDSSDHVMFIIKNMSFSHSLNKKRENVSKEFEVAQDADRLDAIGAIGIARAFAFGGSRSRPLYDPTKKAQSISTTASYRQLKSSTLHHFYEKIFLLKDLINTKSAKKIAQQRHKYMKKYVDTFLLEWEGKK